MPTPFTHLETAQRLLRDEQLPQPVRAALASEGSAFLLGNVAADARTESGLRREDTHFYSYDQGIHEHPWRVMMGQFPDLWNGHSPARRAFLAGYVAHLSMDEWWSLKMLGPHFAKRDWAPGHVRFFMLHILLIHMDERDRAVLENWHQSMLRQAAPRDWLPFMSDSVLAEWRDLIAQQLPPDGTSLTLAVFGGRINRQPEELRAILDSPEQMQTGLWAHIPLDLLAEVESGMYAFAREQLLAYWDESARFS